MPRKEVFSYSFRMGCGYALSRGLPSSSPRDSALFALSSHYGLQGEEATLLTLEDVDLKNRHIRIYLKKGLSTYKPLWRHSAKLLRPYLRIRQDVSHGLFTGGQVVYLDLTDKLPARTTGGMPTFHRQWRRNEMVHDLLSERGSPPHGAANLDS
jgi:integrase